MTVGGGVPPESSSFNPERPGGFFQFPTNLSDGHVFDNLLNLVRDSHYPQ